MKPCISFLLALLSASSLAFGQKVEPDMLIGAWRLTNMDAFKKSEGCDWLDHHIKITSALYSENNEYDCKGTGRQSAQSDGTWRIKGSNRLVVVWAKRNFPNWSSPKSVRITGRLITNGDPS